VAPAWGLTCSHSRGSCSSLQAQLRAPAARDQRSESISWLPRPGRRRRRNRSRPGIRLVPPGPGILSSCRARASSPFSRRPGRRQGRARRRRPSPSPEWLVSPARPSSGRLVAASGSGICRACARAGPGWRAREARGPRSLCFFFPALPLPLPVATARIYGVLVGHWLVNHIRFLYSTRSVEARTLDKLTNPPCGPSYSTG